MNPHLESLISRLRAHGLAEDEIQSLVAPLTGADPKYVCLSCGRSSEITMTEIRIAGEVVYSSPTRWVYCYRERDQPFGLCDQCFSLGRFDGFTPGEIAYFRENFAQNDEPHERFHP
jgi:hypothetical protein